MGVRTAEADHGACATPRRGCQCDYGVVEGGHDQFEQPQGRPSLGARLALLLFLLAPGPLLCRRCDPRRSLGSRLRRALFTLELLLLLGLFQNLLPLLLPTGHLLAQPALRLGRLRLVAILRGWAGRGLFFRLDVFWDQPA